jgi:ankyrin repeat protein
MNTTAIHLAVRHGHIECLKLLIKYGANLKKPVYELNTILNNPTEFSTIQDLSKQFINDMTIKYDTRANFLFNVSSTSSSISSSSVKNPSQDNTTTTSNPLNSTNKPTSNSKIRSVDYGACFKLLESQGFEFDYDYAINQSYQFNNYELLEALLKGSSTSSSSSSDGGSGSDGGNSKIVGIKDKVNTMYLLHRGIKDRKKTVFFKLLLRCGVDVNYIDNDGKIAAFYASKFNDVYHFYVNDSHVGFNNDANASSLS